MVKGATMGTRLHPALCALVGVGLMFLPAGPAYLWLWPNVRGTEWLLPVQVAVYAYFLAGTLLIARGRWSLGQLGLNRLGIGLGVVCGALFSAGRIVILLGTNIPLAAQPPSLTTLALDTVFYFAVVGLVEELLFRGLIYRALEDWRGLGWAIWGSSLLFGLYHVGWQGPLGGVATGFAGLFFACLRWRGGGIVGIILAHGLIDITAAAVLPSLDLAELGWVRLTSPPLVVLGYALLLGLPPYLWLVHPRLARALGGTGRGAPPAETLSHRR